MRLLIVEDERRVRAFLCRGFSEEGFTVVECAAGPAALELLVAERFDLALVDWMLPGLAGIDLLLAVRAREVTTPIIMLAARDALDERLRALNGGADDYLVKPFSFEEVLARVQAVLRRAAGRPSSILRCADLTLDPVSRSVERAGVELHLTAREFALLQLLLEHSGEPLSRPRIVEGVWDQDDETFSNVVEVYIRHLRTKVDEPFGSPLIHTVRGVGYVLRERP